MGGKAFSGLLPPTSFPRLPPPIYHALKARLTPVLETLYHFVATPHEAPEKLDHGDLDFTVASPRTVLEEDKVAVPIETCKQALRALHVVPMPGNRTSSYAVPMKRSEWEEQGLAQSFDQLDKNTDSSGLFYQVDVHPATDEAEARRIVFFNSYGDLGMIMGLIAANNGLKLSPHALRMPNGIWKPVILSENMSEVMEFMGFDLAIRDRGFQTKRQIFEWVGASRLFDPHQFRSKGDGIRDVKIERTMYGEFLEWAEEQKQKETSTPEVDVEGDWEALKARRREEALIRFGGKEAYDKEVQIVALRAKAKNIFNGNKVKEWLNSGNDWELTRLVMHIAKESMGGEEGIWDTIQSGGEEGVKQAVLSARPEAELALRSKRTTESSSTDAAPQL
ncbi:hypothetical protein DL96DRAFT_1612564 [Flagelloscypha sp. PMI_526]|nr:hypothetical protein DL96DRAFT_1612564 [Flagelloscypha sp. PMI_526]